LVVVWCGVSKTVLIKELINNVVKAHGLFFFTSPCCELCLALALADQGPLQSKFHQDHLIV
jgi:hypothetical protein